MTARDANDILREDGPDALRDWTAQAKPYELPDESAPPFSEGALALEFAARHARHLRHVAKWGKWLLWDGAHWALDETRKTFSMARKICFEAATTINKKGAKSIASAKTRAAVISLASDDQRLAATTDRWDNDPEIFNAPTKGTEE
jgi:putative DNA primase/helicase